MSGDSPDTPGSGGRDPGAHRPGTNGSAPRGDAARGPARASAPDLLVLHGVRLLGMAEPAALATRFGLGADEAAELLLDAQASGWVTYSRFAGTGGWNLTDRGRAHDERLLAAELGSSREVVHGVHEAFVPLNARFQNAVTRWQLRPVAGDELAANDHGDHRWDDRTIGDLAAVVGRVMPLCARLADELLRFAGYDRRLSSALDRARAGERSAVDGLRGESGRGDSLHTVWFELHEDLLATLGISR